MKARRIRENVYWVGAVDWDRRLFDGLIPLPDGTSYNAYFVKGSEKTALIDTVDPAMSAVLLSRLEGLDIAQLDYVVANHAEQDHSGSLPHILSRYPEAKVLTTASGKKILIDLLRIGEDRFIAVADDERISLGDKTLQFVHTPWVHWPETMATYVPEDKILFSCDFFGSHIATSKLFAGEDENVCDAAKAYYAQVMMPFRAAIRKNLEKLEKYPTEMIAPSHGPIHDVPTCIVDNHRDWVSDNVTNSAVIAYVSMHGSTEVMADYLAEALAERGIEVHKFNLAVANIGRLATALVDAATLVVGSCTVLSGAHPNVISAVFLANALRPKIRFASVFGSYSWGGKAVEQIAGMMPNLKVDMLQGVMARGYPKAEDFLALDQLTLEIANRHAEIKVA